MPSAYLGLPTRRALEKIKAEIKELTIDMTPDDESAFKKLSLDAWMLFFPTRMSAMT
jgi:hypothetical protein